MADIILGRVNDLEMFKSFVDDIQTRIVPGNLYIKRNFFNDLFYFSVLTSGLGPAKETVR